MESNTAASNKLTIRSLIWPLLLILIFGALAGLFTAVVGSLFYIVLLFPVGMGIAGGAVLGLAVRAAKVRKTWQVVLLSVLTAAVIYGSYHYGRYLALQVQSLLLLSSRVEEGTFLEKLQFARIFVDYALKEETGHTGFPGYMLYRAQSGISIGRFYSENRLVLNSIFAWLYWAVELGIILYITAGMGKKQLLVPVCEACGSRFSREKHLGGTTPANEPLLLDLLRCSDVIELGRLLEKDAGLPSVELYMQRCEACGKSTSYLTVRRALLTPKGSVALLDISKATLRPQDSMLFLQQLKPEAN